VKAQPIFAMSRVVIGSSGHAPPHGLRTCRLQMNLVTNFLEQLTNGSRWAFLIPPSTAVSNFYDSWTREEQPVFCRTPHTPHTTAHRIVQ
jgi:hypothetical protein